jgi:hypothetical protein
MSAPRDRLQDHGPHVPVELKAELVQHIYGAGVRSIELTSFVSPKAVPQLADAAELCARLPDAELPGTMRSAFVATQGGLERAVAAGVDEISTTISGSSISLTMIAGADPVGDPARRFSSESSVRLPIAPPWVKYEEDAEERKPRQFGPMIRMPDSADTRSTSRRPSPSTPLAIVIVAARRPRRGPSLRRGPASGSASRGVQQRLLKNVLA